MRAIARDLSGAPFLADEAARAVMAALREPQRVTARFVGGCVRNALLGLAVADIDVATSLKPEEVMARAERAGLKAVPTGIAHGTVTVISAGRPFEVTTLRVDVRTTGRHAEVAFTEDWVADARRRDFTINALYADETGALYDPTGGLADLAAGRVVFIGAARERIREDFLRILRFFRIHAWYGLGPLDAAGLAACTEERAGLERLSGERIQAELLKLLAAGDPSPALDAMERARILAVVLPPPFDVEALRRLVAAETAGLDRPSPLRRLAMLLGPRADMAPLRPLRFSNDDSAQLKRHFGALEAPPLGPQTDESTLRRLLYVEPNLVVDRIVLSAARTTSDLAPWRALIASLSAIERPVFPVGGHDILALGVTGAKVGAILEALEATWIGADFAPTRAALLAEAQALAAKE